MAKRYTGLAALTLMAAVGPTTAADVLVCWNYGCAQSAQIEFSPDEALALETLFREVETAAQERAVLALAVAEMMRAAARRTPIHNDLRENDDIGIEGRMDCIDHSTTTTSYLHYLARRGLLRFHRVLAPVHRAPILINDHWSAQIEDMNGERFAVDAWFFDHGHPAAVIPLEIWRRGHRHDG